MASLKRRWDAVCKRYVRISSHRLTFSRSSLILLLGTLGYFAPEVFEDWAFYVESDLFSLGVTLAEVSKGKSFTNWIEVNPSVRETPLGKWKQEEWDAVINSIEVCFQLNRFSVWPVRCSFLLCLKFLAHRVIWSKKWLPTFFAERRSVGMQHNCKNTVKRQ